MMILDTINNMETLCSDLAPVLRLVGIVVKGIQIVVPIMLIIIGMLDFAKAVTEKDDGKIKDAEKKLINRAIAAVLVFLVIFLVSVLMKLLGKNEYEKCMTCITSPFSESCPSGLDPEY